VSDLRLEVLDRTAWITLDRPDELNSLTLELLAELRGVCDRIEVDQEIRVAVITGAGRAFSVGADIHLLQRAFDPADRAALHTFVDAVNGTLLRLEALPVPVVAAVNGLARAGGFELLLACDLAIAADDARIGDVHSAFGMMPGGGSTHRLPRRIGPLRAAELIYTSRWLDGPTAARMGLVLRSVPTAELRGAVEALVADLVDKPRGVLGAIKQTMAVTAGLDPVAATAAERRAFLAYLDTVPDAREGFRAYMEDREPSWRG
jgi:enoyl-CoA hydratase/carnithine racemase